VKFTTERKERRREGREWKKDGARETDRQIDREYTIFRKIAMEK
jgi:hypothetical protein